MARTDVPEEPITKLDAARRQLVTALRLFFDNRDSVSICTLAQASREVLDSLCRHRNLPAFIDNLARDNQLGLRELKPIAEYGRNFFKHADRDPDATLDDFYDGRNDGVLFVALQDLRTLCDNRLPVEAQVFETWFLATFSERIAVGNEGYLEKLEALYPEFQSKGRDELKKLARAKMQEALTNSSVMSHPNTDDTEVPRWR